MGGWIVEEREREKQVPIHKMHEVINGKELFWSTKQTNQKDVSCKSTLGRKCQRHGRSEAALRGSEQPGSHNLAEEVVESREDNLPER